MVFENTISLVGQLSWLLVFVYCFIVESVELDSLGLVRKLRNVVEQTGHQVPSQFLTANVVFCCSLWRRLIASRGAQIFGHVHGLCKNIAVEYLSAWSCQDVVHCGRCSLLLFVVCKFKFACCREAVMRPFFMLRRCSANMISSSSSICAIIIWHEQLWHACAAICF